MKKILIIIFLGLLTYTPVLFNGFVWDDEVMFQKAASIPANVYFRPAISTVYSIIYNLFGPRPFFFHFFQLIFHIATAVLIYYLFRRFFKETISLILALIFLVHPANVEAVSFASAMQEVAFTLTGITGLYLFVSSENLSITKVFSATLLLFIALLMKETAIVFFVLVFCYLILFRRKNQDVLISYSIFSTILLMIYFLFRLSGSNLYVQGQGLFPIMRVSLATRLINIPMIILYYLTKFSFPLNLGIAQNWVVQTINFQDFWWPLLVDIGFFLLLIAEFVYVSSPRRRGSSLSLDSRLRGNDSIFFFLWFLVGLLPHLQIIPLNMTVAERWLYFPMIGLLGMIGSLLDKSKIQMTKSKIIIALTILIIFIFSVRSFIRVLDWQNGLALYSRDIKKNSSFDLQNNLGVELFRAGRFDQAKKYFEISTDLAPYWWVNWNNLGASFEREKNYKKAADYYQKSINNGQYYLAYENLAKILVLHGKDQKKTEDFLQRALKLFPENQNLLMINKYFQEKNNK